jgi:hypothetical protein
LILGNFTVKNLHMTTSFRFIAAISIIFLTSCAAKRTPFSPGGPTTVGMPAELSERERLFIPEIDSALRREGLVPVKNGNGDLQLDFSMAAGPINITTRIALSEDEAVLITGNGRAAGAPLIGRSNVAQKSFSEAFDEFSSSLSRTASSRGWSSASGGSSPAYPDAYYQDETLPVY